MRIWRSGSIVIAAAGVAMLAAGCGSSGSGGTSRPTSAALRSEVENAVSHATSVHMTGTGINQGKSFSANLTMTHSGGFSGTLGEGQMVVTILSAGKTSYVKATASLLQSQHAPPSVCSLICGKWIKAPGMTSGLSWSSFVTTWTSKSGSSITLSPGGPFTIDGEPAWKMNLHSNGILYVAATGTPYPLEAVKGSTDHLTFSEWNTATVPPPPPASEIFSGGNF